MGTGPVEPGWRPVQALYQDPDVLRGWLARVGARLGTGELRVAASIGFQGYAARLWSVGLGALALEGHVVQLPSSALLWSDDRGTVQLHLEHPVVRPGAHGDGDLWDGVVGEHLTPMVAAVRRLCPLSERLLWGNAASALTGAAGVLDAGRTGPATATADRLLTRPPLRGSVEDPDEDARRRRRSCCLFYRVPGGQLCGDCVLAHPPSARVRA